MNRTPLRQRNFSLLWSASIISITGDWALRVALPIYVLRLTGSPAAVSGIVLAGFSASLAGTRVAGRFRPVARASACFALFGLVDLAIFNYPRLSTALWPVIGMFFLIGIPGVLAFVTMLTLFHVQAADQLRGRMFAVLAVCQAGAGMVGAIVAGALGQTVSVVSLLTGQGAGYVLAGIALRLLAGRGPDSLTVPAGAVARPGNHAEPGNQAEPGN